MKLRKSLKDNLEEAKKSLETIAGDWNGEDAQFQSGGVPYSEDDAHAASDGVDLIDQLLPILNTFGLDD